MKRFGLALTLIALAAAAAAVPYPKRSTPEATDMGRLSAQPGATDVTVTLALAIRAPAEAEKLLAAQQTPGDPQFHRFLTPAQFAARFAPAEADVAKLSATLAGYGLKVRRSGALTVQATGTATQIENAFAVNLHHFQVPATDHEEGYSFHAPLAAATLPAGIAAQVSGLVGLDSRPRLHPNFHRAPLTRAPTARTPQAMAPAATAGNPPGLWTVTDFAGYYDVLPLYAKGVSGKGRTIGIVTLASFTPADAFSYWSDLGLKVNPKRLTVVDIDGGPGAPSDGSGSGETTLDVEQSGGVAPGAKMIVYQAPNTNQGFLDAFVEAIETNAADSISVSWGFWELFSNLQNSPVTDPISGRTVGATQAMHEQFVRAALQGQSLFSSSGDNGAYEANGDAGCYGPFSPDQPDSCSLTLSVNYPASDSAITAAGGTTLAGPQGFCLDASCTNVYTVDIAQESVWGWDYLIDLCSVLGFDPISCGIFPAGSGGGVSIAFGVPGYQSGLQGIQRSQAGQIWQAGPAVAASIGIVTTHAALPAHYRGRNVPDISFNADPDTGYIIYYTSSSAGFGVLEFFGGTSFVAPQLNGVAALLGDRLHSRLGLLNYPLYALARGNQAYGGSHPPMHPVGAGDNWFYYGSNGYNLGAGLGTLDVSNFAAALQRMHD